MILPSRVRLQTIPDPTIKMRRPLLLLLLFVAVASFAQTDPVVMTVNGVAVPRSEFEYSYNKNNGEGVIDKKTVKEYAELYANYKLKVAAALAERLDTLSSFKEEFAMYRDQQVLPTLVTDDDVLAEARQIYERSKEAIGPNGLVLPAHIFLALSSQATDSEQARVRQRMDSVYQALRAGADFAELAGKVSEDPATASKGGLFPVWIGPNQVFKEFEDVAYSLQPGEMSRPFLTPAGYHIVLVKDRKPLEPFDSLKTTIVRNLEQRGIRNQIIEERLGQAVAASEGRLTREQVVDKRADSLAAIDAESKYLIQEYHDGLLLYEISNRTIWEKAANDEAGLRAWFETHKKDYTWNDPHYKGIAYHVKDKADVKAVKKALKGVPFDQWADVLRTTFNSDSIIRIRVEKGLFKIGDNGTIDRMVFNVLNPKVQTGYADYPIDAVYGKKLKKLPEDYTDVRGKVVEDYQGYLESEWIASLRRQYPVQINEEVLKTVNNHQ